MIDSDHGNFIEDCINRVRKIAPNLDSSNHKILRESHSNLVILVDGYVFKFPKDIENSNKMSKEIKLIKMLTGSPIRMPSYVYEDLNAVNKFGGYQFINGVPLNTLNALSSKMIDQFVNLLNFLHRKEYAELRRSGVEFFEPNEWMKQFMDFGKLVNQQVLRLLDNNLQKSVEKEFETMTKTPFNFKPTLVHGDLYKDNVLVQDGDLAAVIDWGYSSFGDPAIDIAAIAVDFPLEAIRIVESLNDNMDDKAGKRIEFYIRTEPLFEILDGALMRNEEEIAFGITRLKHQINRIFEFHR